MIKLRQLNLEMLPIAFIAEYKYCQRAAFYFLTGAENGEEENSFIQSGRTVHLNVDISGKHYRTGFEEAKSVRLLNYQYGLIGKTDLIREYSNDLIPVEYKSGAFKRLRFHKFQLLLQALCLQKQYHKRIKKGFVYFYQVNKLCKYVLSKEDYSQTIKILKELRKKLLKGDISLFLKVNLPNCIHCSFYDICIPFLI